jgi:hypothetical protein
MAMPLTTTKPAAIELASCENETGLERALRLVADAPLDLTGLSRQEVFALECAASKVRYERRDDDSSAYDLQMVACDRLAVIDGRDRRRVDLVEAAQSRRIERAGLQMARAA